MSRRMSTHRHVVEDPPGGRRAFPACSLHPSTAKDNTMIAPTPRHSASHARRLSAAWLILFLAGCRGPTHTAGTRGLGAKDLSILSIPQLPKEAHVQIHAIQFDGGGDEYEIGKSRDFYLMPRDHTASFTFAASVPSVGGIAGMAGWLMPKSVILPGPRDIPLGPLTAGKTYELALPTEGLDKLMEGGQLSFVREKVK